MSDPRKDERRAKFARIVMGATIQSARYLADVASGKHTDSIGEVMTNRQRAATEFVKGFMAMERARTVSEAPRQPGVIVVHARLEDTPQNRLSWEEDAAKLNARAIEAVVVAPKKEPDAA